MNPAIRRMRIWRLFLGFIHIVQFYISLLEFKEKLKYRTMFGKKKYFKLHIKQNHILIIHKFLYPKVANPDPMVKKKSGHRGE